VPPGSERIAARVKALTGRELVLRSQSETFGHGVEVRLDGRLLGGFEFLWDDEQPAEALDDLQDALSPLLDEELGREDG
jgi:hypothetical protein